MMTSRIVAAAAALASMAVTADTHSHWNGGRNVPVHRLAPLDSDGEKISPSDPQARPVSTVRTCSQCHDVEAMAGGSHFRTGMSTNEAPESVRTEPWFLVDGSGTQIPLSLHGQEGAFAPAALGISAWQWTKEFGRHFPGGGAGMQRVESADASRWFVTGSLEPNCFACHASSADYDSSEWVRQVRRENFAGAATAALGIADVGGMNSRLDEAWDVARGPHRDDKVFEVMMNVGYDLAKFDSKDRTVFPIGRPRSENCLACHSATEKGMAAHDIAGDVHLKAGLSCTDCHKNGMDHRVSTVACAECHTRGDANGRLAGPRPAHTGIPLVHFERLSCTVCHSGVTAGGELAEVRTSRANRIGVYGRAKWDTDAPYIVEPVFMKNADGVVEPRRVMWPAYFARPGADGALAPMKPEDVAAVAGDALDVVARVEKVLADLNTNPNRPGDAVLTENGLFYRTPAGDRPLYHPSIPTPADATEEAKKEIGAKNEALAAEASYALQSLLFGLKPSDRDQPALLRDGKMFVYAFQPRPAEPGAYDDGSDALIEKADYKSRPGEGELEIGYFTGGRDEFRPLLDKFTRTEYLKLKAAPGKSVTAAMVAAALAKIGPGARYIGHGKAFALKDGGLVAEDSELAAPVSWPLSHDVRRAGLSRGAKPFKCADCHTADSSFFFGEIAATGPVADLPETGALDRSAAMDVPQVYHQVLGFTFLMRPMFKVFLWTAFVVLCLFAVAIAAWALPRLFEKVPAPEKGFWKFCVVCLDLLLVCATGYLAVSGVLGWLAGGMGSWWLMLHMVAGGGLAAALLALAVIRFKRNGEKCPVGWTLFALLGLAVVFTAVMPMMTVFGTEGQRFLLVAHRLAAIAFTVVAAVVCLRVWRGR